MTLLVLPDGAVVGVAPFAGALTTVLGQQAPEGLRSQPLGRPSGRLDHDIRLLKPSAGLRSALVSGVAALALAAVSSLMTSTALPVPVPGVGSVGGAGAGPLVPRGVTHAVVPQGSTRIMVDYTTHFDPQRNETYISPLGLIEHNSGVTEIVVGQVRLVGSGEALLNDIRPSAERYRPMWSDLATMRAHGEMRMLALIGGWPPGTFAVLERNFDAAYDGLSGVLRVYGFDGSADDQRDGPDATIRTLIDRLHADFGSSFVITLAPNPKEVLEDRSPKTLNFTTISYTDLLRDKREVIDWLKVRFFDDEADSYSRGWIDAGTPSVRTSSSSASRPTRAPAVAG